MVRSPFSSVRWGIPTPCVSSPQLWWSLLGTFDVLWFAPPALSERTWAWSWSSGLHPMIVEEHTGSHTFPGNPAHACRALRPRRDLGARPHCGSSGVVCAVLHRIDSREFSFGAQSRGPQARCLRFAPALERHYARLASRCWPGFPGRAVLPPRVPLRGFGVSTTSRPPRQSCSCRTERDGVRVGGLPGTLPPDPT